MEAVWGYATDKIGQMGDIWTAVGTLEETQAEYMNSLQDAIKAVVETTLEEQIKMQEGVNAEIEELSATIAALRTEMGEEFVQTDAQPTLFATRDLYTSLADDLTNVSSRPRSGRRPTRSLAD
jgi:hypothetical protein